MFKKPFAFRKRKGADHDDPPELPGQGAQRLARETLSPSSTTYSTPLRDRSPGSASVSSNTTSVDRQFTGISEAPTALRGAEASTQDPLGLKVIHRPPGERRVDVVFVHGLGGSSRSTWSHNRNPDFFWPLKFLPLEPDINEARILTFGYNANFRPGSGRSKMSVLDFAKDLLYDLKYAQDESVAELEDLGMGDRPIIFVVHSLGGLIVKEAYMQGRYDPTYENVIQAISSIIFLSTPHRGTNLADTLNRILQVSFITSPMQFVAELAAGSQTLQKLNEQFRHVAPKLQIVSFYETRPTPMFKKSQLMVLEKDSSVLGYPGEISKALDADHHTVCKYPSRDDPRYITVRNVLKTLIGKSISKDLPQTNPQITDFQEYLSVTESPDGDYTFFRDRWTPGTCSWITDHEAFTGWLDDACSNPRVLWVSGNAASGKSILSSFVINHLVQLGLPCHYFFIRFISQEKRRLSIMLRTLAYQLTNSTPAYAEKLRQLETASMDLKTADYRNIWQWLFKQTLFQLDGLDYPIYWVIDGVDEAEQPGSIIKLLSELHQTAIPLRVMVVSRKTHAISSAFQKLAKYVHMETIFVEGNVFDIQSYIDHEMDLAGDAPYRESITAQLLDRAKGNFLWIHLAVQKINSCHTKLDVENALKELPSGMEALYHRMALTVQSQSSSSDRDLGQSILGWAICARRLLTVEELGDALGNDGVLEIYRTIADLCGGFVTVDHEGKVAMIHETAREYLTCGAESNQPLAIDSKTTNSMLFKRCVARLTDPTLRSQINRHHPVPLLEYATTSWSHHLVQSAVSTRSDILDVLVNFLGSSHILTWIHVSAKRNQLRTLIVASRHLADVALKLRRRNDDELSTRQATAVIEGWATDLVKIVGKFGNNLKQHPDSIYKLIPPFCPEDSMIYQQFGRRESRALQVSGYTTSTWDDCLARFSLAQGLVASSVIAAGSRIAVLAVIRKTSQVIIYNSVTFEEQRRIIHPERVLSIQTSKRSDILVSYGYLTTKVWDIATGECLKTIKNPAKRPRPHALLFDEKQNTILACGEDRRIRSVSLDNDSAEEWSPQCQIDEQGLDETMVNFPICSALSPDGSMIAFGYRNHPLTVWELNPPMLLGQCIVPLDATDMTIECNTWGEVFKLAWHPFSGEVFGLTQVGLLFRWDPYEEEASLKVQSGADCLAVSSDGSLVATGDAVGTIKIYATPDFSVLYQLASQDPVFNLSFSTDSRRLYDIRGTYGNVWEPNTLVRLADCPDHNSDSHSETESLAKISLQIEHHFARVDSVIALAGQTVGPLYCYGTEGGIAMLCEVGNGKVCELERLASFMPIEHIAWSEDGRIVALADLSGKLAIKRVARSSENRNVWQVSHEFELAIPTGQGHINQLIFHPAGRKLFLPTASVLFSVDLESQALTESTLELSVPTVKWTCHPMQPDTLLAFGHTKVYSFSWTDLRQSEVHSYFPPRIGGSLTSSDPSLTRGRTGSFQKDSETLGKVISSIDSPQVLLGLSLLSASGHIENQYLIFDVGNLQLSKPGEMTESGYDLHYTLLPQDIASRVHEPLAFLSRKRLVFLDVDRWICTWRLAASSKLRPEARKPSEAGGIEQYYFLPGDWVTSNDTSLCTVTPDGTLLCPRNGDVVTVQAARLRK